MTTSRVMKSVLLAVSISVALGANIYLRSYPIAFPQIKAQARKVVDQNIRQAAGQDVQNKFPQFYPLAKDEILKSRMAEYKKENKAAIKKQVEDLYKKLKERYQDPSGQTFIMELDCWHWTRYVENILKTGHPGDKVINGKQWDMMMLAPLGWEILWDDFLYYLSAFIYRVFTIFYPAPLLKFLFYLPLFYSAVFTMVLFAVAFRYGKYAGAVISCLFVGLTGIFIPRSCAGWFDKDTLSMTFPIAIFFAHISSLKARTFKHRMIGVVVTSFLVGLFAFTWTFWWFILAIIVAYEIARLAYLSLYGLYSKKRFTDEIKEHAIALGAVVLMSLFWVVVLAGAEPIKDLYSQIKLAVVFNKPLMPTIWPNVFSTVGEMKKPGLVEVMRTAGGTGGILLFVFAVSCMAALLIKSIVDKRFEAYKRDSIMILTVWFLIMLFATTRGIRFIMFLPFPLGISMGWVVGDLLHYFWRKKNIVVTLAIGLVCLFLSYMFINNGARAAANCVPLMDATWYRILNLMKEKTPEDTIINSWWDYGDWFKVVARRRVIFDGQSQGNPQAYWMAKAMLTDDENLSISILRMLNNGGNKAFEIINEHVKDPLQAVLILESILGADPDKAKELLRKFMPELPAQDVMKILYYKPPPAGFVVDNSMPYKMAAISFLGNWDFSKVYIAQNFDKKEKEHIIQYLRNLGRNDKDMERFYQEVFLISTKRLDDWLSRRLLFYSDLADGQEKDGMIYFNNGYIYDQKEQMLRSSSAPVPLGFFVLEGDQLMEKRFGNPAAGYSVFIFKTDKGYKSILCDRDLVKSMFVRLYYFRGAGLRHFLPFIEAEDGNNYIRYFTISW